MEVDYLVNGLERLRPYIRIKSTPCLCYIRTSSIATIRMLTVNQRIIKCKNWDPHASSFPLYIIARFLVIVLKNKKNAGLSSGLIGICYGPVWKKKQYPVMQRFPNKYGTCKLIIKKTTNEKQAIIKQESKSMKMCRTDKAQKLLTGIYSTLIVISAVKRNYEIINRKCLFVIIFIIYFFWHLSCVSLISLTWN